MPAFPMLTNGWFRYQRRRGLCWCSHGGFGATLFKPHDYDIEHGCKKKTETGYSEHSEKDCSAQRLAHFGAGARTNNKWNNAEDERERRHQDRTQSKATRFDRGGETVFVVAVLNLFCEFDDEDGVLTSQPNKHNKADLREDVVLHRTQPDTVDRTEQTHGDDENDCEWQRPALVKRREQQKNEQNAKRENVNRAVACELLLQCDFCPLGREAGRQNLFSETFNSGKRLATAGARSRLTAQVGRGKHVVTRDLVGAAYLLYGRNRPERNNSARVIARFQQANIVRT